VVRIGGDVAEALEYLHGLGVVHRDVKPSNVLLDEHGRASLADFGIAAVAWGDEEGIVVRVRRLGRASARSRSRGARAAGGRPLCLGALLFELLSRPPSVPREATDDEIRTASPPPVASPFPGARSTEYLVTSLLSKTPEGDRRPPRRARAALRAIEAQIGGTAATSPEPPVGCSRRPA